MSWSREMPRQNPTWVYIQQAEDNLKKNQEVTLVGKHWLCVTSEKIFGQHVSLQMVEKERLWKGSVDDVQETRERGKNALAAFCVDKLL